MGTFVSTDRYTKLLIRLSKAMKRTRRKLTAMDRVRLTMRFNEVLTRQSSLTYKDVQEGRIWVHGVNGGVTQ